MFLLKHVNYILCNNKAKECSIIPQQKKTQIMHKIYNMFMKLHHKMALSAQVPTSNEKWRRRIPVRPRAQFINS